MVCNINPRLYHLLSDLYLKPSKKGGSFLSADFLYKVFKRQYPDLKITRHQVEIFLTSQPGYTRNQNFRTHFRTRRVIVGGLKQLLQADLINVSGLKEFNDNITFLLVVIDTFSKFIWVVPLLNKKPSTVLDAFKKNYVKYSDFPYTLTTDKGKEFQNDLLKRFMRDNNVKFFSSEGSTKAQIAERVIHTLKQMVAKYLSTYNKFRYIDVLPDLVESYNNLYKSSLDMTPSQVNTKNMRNVFITCIKVIYRTLSIILFCLQNQHLKTQI